jgi:hypothetical protein
LLRDAILPGQQNNYVSTDFRPIFEYGVARSVGRIDGASTFYRKTAPYSFLSLESILVNVPENEVPALVRLIEDERIHMTATDSITR